MLAVPWVLSLLSSADAWPQWGGPERDFCARDVELADSWADAEPRTLWERELGNGDAAIVVGGETLYTTYGTGEREVVVALDAASGTPRWTYAYDVRYSAHRDDFGGPHATPLLVGDVLVTVSIDARVHGFDRVSGALRWSRDLMTEHDVDLPQSGYAASPLAWGALVLLPGLGGRAPGALALSAQTGETVWARHAFLSSHASPILVEAGGREQVVFHGMNFLVGLHPADGALLWRTRLRDDAMDNVAFTPLWDAERSQLIVSHSYDGVGTRALRLARAPNGVAAAPAWTNRRAKVQHTNGVLLGGRLYVSDGDEPAFLTALDLDEGRLVFKRRDVSKANLLRAGDKLLILDEDGVLRLARPTEDGLEVLAEREVLRSNAWTVPTLVGRRLYLRDRERIKAMELP